jgi:hypothetical protein
MLENERNNSTESLNQMLTFPAMLAFRITEFGATMKAWGVRKTQSSA